MTGEHEQREPSNVPRQIKSLKEVLEDETKYHYAKFYHTRSLIPPAPSSGSLLVTYADCTARNLYTCDNPYAEINEVIYICNLSEYVKDMFGKENTLGAAFCVKNLLRGTCPRGFKR